MQTKTINIYSFSELSDDAKQNALEKLADINVDYSDWHEFIIEDWKEKLSDMGFSDIDIPYSGFWSQGDGASFTGKLDIKKFLESQRLKTKFRLVHKYHKEISASVKRISHHYAHENTVSFDYRTYWTNDSLDNQLCKFEEIMKNKIIDICHEIHRSLEREYDYLTSEAAIIETIEANEYEFNIDGNLI